MATALTACNGGGNNAGQDTPPAANGGQAEAPPPDAPPDVEPEQPDEDSDVISVTIPHYKTGDNVGSLYFEPLVAQFNERYAGRFHLNIEPIPQAMYSEQLRQLAIQGMLPPMIEGGLDDVWFEEFILAGDRFVDLWPVFENHPIRPYFNPDNLAYNTADDGRLITVPNPVIRSIHFFYNTALWEPSGPIIDMTWREIASELDGERIAFMTGDNAWTTMLLFSSLVAAEPGGPELLIGGLYDRITDFDHPAIIAALGELQYLMANHSQPNAVGAGFPEAANSFFNLGSAIICNGSWMIGDFREESSDNWGPGFDPDTISGSVYPGNIALANPLGYNWWIPSTASDDEIELAKAFLSFIFEPEQQEFIMQLMGGTIPGFEHTPAFLAARAEDRLMSEYMEAVDGNTIVVPAFADAVYPSIAEHDFPGILPLLIDGTLSPEEFAAELTRMTADATF